MQAFIKKNWTHVLAILIFFVFSMMNFYPAMQGKKLNYTDSVVGMSKEVKDYEKATGEVSYWTNSMFGGMPTYYIYGNYPKDAVDYLSYGSRLFMFNEIGKFFSGMLFFYILMMVLGVAPTLAIFGSICFAFCTNNLVLLETGHGTKLNVVLYSPLIVAGLLMAFRSNKIIGSLIFAIGMAFSIKGDHPQMTYYLGLALLPMMVVYFYKYMKEKKLADFAKICGFLLIGLFLALGTTAAKILPIKEYSEDTMRGKPILKQEASTFSSSSVEGLSWDYAMNWSNGKVDLLQSFIPFAVGGSNNHNLSKDSNFAKFLRKNGMSTRNGVQAPIYWGKLPSTSGTIYFGAIVFMLFFISIFTLNDKLKWWLLTAALLTLLLSLGKNFEIFTRFFYDFVPLYNKFRTPNSVLSVTPVIIALGAFWGLNEMLKNKIDFKKILYPGLGLVIFCFGFGLLAPSFLDMVGMNDARYAQMGYDLDVIMDDRIDVTRSSSFKSGMLMLLALASIWGFYKNKIKKNYVMLIIGLLSVFDLVSTNLNYVKPSKYKNNRSLQQKTQPRKVDTQILQDNDPNYRVFDLSIPTFESAISSYHHKTIGGYHAAKLQRYQDLIDRHISKNNMDVLNMLNTKYIIIRGESEGQEQVQRNTAALGNAWFVNTVKIVASSDEEIEGLNDFDPLGTAIIHKEYENYLPSKSFEKNGSIKLTSYKPNELIYNSNTSSDQLAVFSEIWYGPDKGWKAYINDKPVEHIRANYVLRALKVPAGNNTIKFEFQPDSLKTGSLVAKICSFIMLGALVFFGLNSMRPEDKKWLKTKSV
ncbi:MAG: YfhO family protein [Saprospiraceae bacterium]|nr:YfhO family protein [Bacteroidia bacterium]NNL91289.1 YfhO family protein [Saprospiraceae bacterium]